MSADARRPVRVAHVMGASMGARFIIFNQLKYLVGRGYEVHQVCSPGPWLDELEAAGIRVTTIPISRQMATPGDLLSVARLRRFFAAGRFDIVHLHTAKAGFLGRLAARLAGTPVIIWTNAGFIFHENTPPRRRRALIGLERMAARWCDRILSQNREDVETAVKEGVCGRDKIVWLGNGIDLERFDPANVDPAALDRLRAELGIPADTKVVGIVGRLVKEKGFVEFFEAARIVRARYPRVKFLAVGPHEPEKPDAVGPEVVRGTELEANTIFLAEMRIDVVELLSLMDVVVLPSHREGLPRLPIEAGALCKPAVVTDIRGCREVVADGETGLVVPVGNGAALADAILSILSDDAKARELGRAAHRRVHELFNERDVFERIAGHYEELIEKKGLALDGR